MSATTSRRARFVAVALLLAALIAPWRQSAALHSPSAAAQSPSSDVRPNIILILLDDADLAMMEQLPGLRAIVGDAGATFTNYFVGNALCCPSRSSILRGQYDHNHHVTTNEAPSGGFPRFTGQGLEDSTLATWLHDAGYYTALAGKYLNQYPKPRDQRYVPPGWDGWHSEVLGDAALGFQYRLNENGVVVSYGDAPDDYYTDVIARASRAEIGVAVDRRQPFFLYVAPSAPHEPAVPAPRHADAFADARLPTTPSYDEVDVSDKPAWVRDRPPLPRKATRNFERIYRARLQSMLAVQDLVEGLLDTLRDTDQLDHTYIVLTSDNGYHFGEHRLGMGKETGYEEDIRVPLSVRGPGIAPGGVVEQLAVNNDLAPTVAAIAGVTPPTFVDGRSLLPLLLAPGERPAWRQSFKISHAEPDATEHAKHGVPAFIGVRADSFTYIEYETGEQELYDLIADPWQMDNLVGTVDPAFLALLSRRVAALAGCAAATCREIEDQPAPAFPRP